MDPITMALISAGLSVGSNILGARKAKKTRKKQLKGLYKAIEQTRRIMGKGLSQQEGLSKLATKQKVGGYEAAQREAQRLGRGQKQNILNREQQLTGQLSQGLANRGLGSTTVGANLQRGIASDTTRSLGDVDEGLAALMGELALGKAGAESGGTEALAQLAAQRSQLESSLGQMGVLQGGQLGNFEIGSWGGGDLGSAILQGLGTGLGVYGGARQQQDIGAFLEQLYGGKMGRLPPAGMNLTPFVS